MRNKILFITMERNATPVISGKVRITILKNKSFYDCAVRAEKK